MLCSEIKTTSVMAGTREGRNDLRLPRMPARTQQPFVPVGYETPPAPSTMGDLPDVPGVKSPGSEVLYSLDPSGRIWLQHGPGQTPYLHSRVFAVGVRQWTDLIYQVSDEVGLPPAVIAGVMSYRSGGDASSTARSEAVPGPAFPGIGSEDPGDPFQDSVDPSIIDPGQGVPSDLSGSVFDPDPIFFSASPSSSPPVYGLLHLDFATASAYSGIPVEELTEDRLLEPSFNLIYGSQDLAYVLNNTSNLIEALAYIGRGESFDPYFGIIGGGEALDLIGSINQAIEYGFSGIGHASQGGSAGGWMGASLLLWASIGGLLLGLGAKGAFRK